MGLRLSPESERRLDAALASITPDEAIAPDTSTEITDPREGWLR